MLGKFLLSLLVIAIPAVAQTAEDLSATRSALNIVIDSLGGPKLQLISTVRATGKISVFINGASKSGTIIWKNARNAFRYETTGEDITETLVSDGAQTARLRDGKVEKLLGHVGLSILPPHLPGAALARWITASKPFIGSKPTLQPLRQDVLKNRPVLVFEIYDGADDVIAKYTRQSWLVDGTDGRPVAVIQRVPDHFNAGDLTTFRQELSDYRFVDGVAIPFHIETYIEERLAISVDLEAVEFNQSVTDSDFEIAAEGVR
jgi:hypothetical protein